MHSKSIPETISEDDLSSQEKIVIAHIIDQHASRMLKMLVEVGQEFPELKDDICTRIADEGLSLENDQVEILCIK